MSQLLFQYHPVHPTTWVYLSSLLLIGLFFKFNRFWSVRNLDLVLLILLSPGLLLVHFGERMMASAASLEITTPAASSQAAEDGPKRAGTAGDVEGVSAGPGEPGANEGRASEIRTSQVRAREESPAETVEEVAKRVSEEVARNAQTAFAGYLWLLGASGLLLVRLLFDPMMVRRPLLEPNLSTGGLAFIGCSLFVFLMANVVNSPSTNADLQGPRSAARLLGGVASKEDEEDDLGRHGPGNALLHSIPALVTHPIHWQDTAKVAETRHVRLAKLMAVLSNLAIVVGMVLIGYRHFGSTKMGLGAAALYLMLPYNVLLAGHVDHVLPAALLVWAVLSYRQPLWAGMFVGMSIGVVYYPLFLLPLWISFYWERGLMRFLAGVAAMLALSVGSLALISSDAADYWIRVRELFGIWWPKSTGLEGIWGLGWDPAYRFPVIAAFGAICIAFAIWPAQKNLGTLLSCSAAAMVAAQFWHGHGGGLFMAWFLPLTLLTVFRPNLEDRVALSVLGEGWFPRRKLRLANVEQAAAAMAFRPE